MCPWANMFCASKQLFGCFRSGSSDSAQSLAESQSRLLYTVFVEALCLYLTCRTHRAGISSTVSSIRPELQTDAGWDLRRRFHLTCLTTIWSRGSSAIMSSSMCRSAQRSYQMTSGSPKRCVFIRLAAGSMCDDMICASSSRSCFDYLFELLRERIIIKSKILHFVASIFWERWKTQVYT